MDPATRRWWTLLRAASVAQLGALALTALAGPGDPQLALAATYAAVCAFRSFLPRVDLERTVLVDHPLSAIGLGRSAATVAELAFTAQVALLLAGLAAGGAPGWLLPLAWALVPAIALAQGFCWLGVLTLDHRWHAAEELVWGPAMLAVAAALAAAWPALDGLRAAGAAVGLAGALAAAFVMLALDVPMYLRRAAAGRAAGAPVLPVGAGLADAWRRRIPDGRWSTWRAEVTWMTPYFTAGVWTSLAMAWW